MTVVVETPRLRLRRMSEADAEFIRRLVNEPSFIRNIGDKGVQTLDVRAATSVTARWPAMRATASG